MFMESAPFSQRAIDIADVALGLAACGRVQADFGLSAVAQQRPAQFLGINGYELRRARAVPATCTASNPVSTNGRRNVTCFVVVRVVMRQVLHGMLSAFQIWRPDSAGGNETHERKHRRSIAAPPRRKFRSRHAFA